MGNPRTRWEDIIDGHLTDLRSMSVVEMGGGQRRMEASSEGRQCPEGTVVL
jgi:hypothetical protein